MSGPGIASMDGPAVLGDFVLQRRERRLLDAQGRAVKLGSRAMALLIVLAERAGQVIGRDELMALAWPGLVVEPNTLRVHMASLRKALGDSQQQARYIATIPGRGYCLVVGVGAPQGQVAMPSDAPASGAVQGRMHWSVAALPAMVSPMIGREQGLRHLVEAVPRQRLTTLVAAGGMGKTTLALAVAHAVAERFEHGVCFVDLSQAAEDTVASVVARALWPGDEVASPAWPSTLAGCDVLLVLDNCEHVLDAVATLVPNLIGPGTSVRVLATSREPLGLPDEQLHWLEGLTWPEADQMDIAQALGHGAPALLVERVRSCDGGLFSLTPARLGDAVELCRRLDGMPLALELVAARVASLGLRPVLDALDEELLSLRHPRRTAPPRQQTLGALLNWSHALLDDAERAVLRCCGLFAGGFTVDVAHDLMAACGLEASQAVASLAGLLGKSMIQPAPDLGPGCFRLPEATRAFARMHMHAAGEGGAAWQSHRRQLSVWIGQARADRAALGPDAWRQRHRWLGLEVHAALERALARPEGVADALALVGESWSFALAQLPNELLARLIEQVRGRGPGAQTVPVPSQQGLTQVLGNVLQSLMALEAA